MTSLSELDTVTASNEGAVMVVMHPTKEAPLLHEDGRPFTITLYGKDSDKYRDAFRDQNDRNIIGQQRTKNPLKTAVMERGNIELLVAATKEWDVVLEGTEPAPSNAAAYRAAYTKFPWLLDQVDRFVGTTGNFLKA